MRTTLDIEDEVLQAAKESARLKKISVGKMVSLLIRRGLSYRGETNNNKKHYVDGVPVFPSRGGIVTMQRIQEIMDEEGL